MSNSSETDIDLELHFLPAWAQESSKVNRYADHKGEPARGDGRRDRPPRRDFGPRRDLGPRRDGPPRRDQGQGPRPARGPSTGRTPGPPQRGERSGRPEERDVAPLPEIVVAFVPEEGGVDSLSRQIKVTGRAYPLFDIAQMILQKPERHRVTLSIKKKPDGSVILPLFSCAIDDTVWLSEAEAIQHVLEKHFAMFYQPERTQIEPPKGVYTFVAQCGLSGVILGPPNYHDYQNQLRRLHQDKFSRMPFEAFKARVRIVRDEATVKKWLDDQSFRTEFACLNMPEPLKLASREEVDKHFRDTHAANLIRQVENITLTGVASRGIRQRDLHRLVRVNWEAQKHFPLQIATVLSQQFANRGLQFFKVNKTVTHVSVARPHHLDLEAIPVSEGVKRIVDFINATPKCAHKHLLEALAQLPAAPAPAAPSPDGTPPPPAEISPEVAAIQTDLHWLIHQGHVIEFANGTLETAKRPLPRPQKPAPPAAPATVPAPSPQNETPAAPATPESAVAVAAVATESVDQAVDVSGDPSPAPDPVSDEPVTPPVSIPPAT